MELRVVFNCFHVSVIIYRDAVVAHVSNAPIQ